MCCKNAVEVGADPSQLQVLLVGKDAFRLSKVIIVRIAVEAHSGGLAPSNTLSHISEGQHKKSGQQPVQRNTMC